MEIPQFTVRAHLTELRNRAAFAALAVIVGTGISFLLRDMFMALLLKPLGDQTLIYTSPYGGFEFIFKVVLFLGFTFAVPFVLYQLFKFLVPALPGNTGVTSGSFIVASTLLALTGSVFAYMLAMPASLHFLSGIGDEFLNSFISTNEYLSFFMVFILGYAIIFQLPLVMSIIDRVKPLDPGMLLKKQKYLVVISFIIAALVTPTPDLMNQTIMAVPIIVLYQLGTLSIWMRNKYAVTNQEEALYRDMVLGDMAKDSSFFDEQIAHDQIGGEMNHYDDMQDEPSSAHNYNSTLDRFRLQTLHRSSSHVPSSLSQKQLYPRMYAINRKAQALQPPTIEESSDSESILGLEDLLLNKNLIQG